MRAAITVIAAISILAAGAMLGVIISSTIRARSHSTPIQPLHPPSTLIKRTPVTRALHVEENFSDEETVVTDQTLGGGARATSR